MERCIASRLRWVEHEKGVSQLCAYRYATGTWIYGTVGDRYILTGYRRGLPIEERIERISRINGISGLEMIYPADFEPGVESLAEIIREKGLECAIVGVDLTGDPIWQFGSFSSPDFEVRSRAVELTLRTIEAADALEAPAINIWPGEDGYDYPFQVDYRARWERFKSCIVEIASQRKDKRICLEYKPREPRARSLIATAASAALMCNEIGLDNVGVTIDVGHALQAGENIAESLSMLSALGILYHVHLNDNYGSWDDDMMVGSVRLIEFLEMLYYLRTISYEGWLSIDVYPYREDPAHVVEGSIRILDKLNKVLESVGVDEIGRFLEKGSAIPLLSNLLDAVIRG